MESGGEASETKEKQTSCDEAFEVSIVDPSDPTNIRDKPSGATVMQIDGNAVIKVKNSERGWWRIEGNSYIQGVPYREDSYIPLEKKGCWIKAKTKDGSHSGWIGFSWVNTVLEGA